MVVATVPRGEALSPALRVGLRTRLNMQEHRFPTGFEKNSTRDLFLSYKEIRRSMCGVIIYLLCVYFVLLTPFSVVARMCIALLVNGDWTSYSIQLYVADADVDPKELQKWVCNARCSALLSNNVD